MIDAKLVGIAQAAERTDYPANPPYHPDEDYPELRARVFKVPDRNEVYRLFRQLLCSLKLDLKAYSTPEWNPLGDFISPGQTVLIKPNLVRHIHMSGGSLAAVVTHGSLVRCAAEYAAIALQGKGRIVVADAPIQSADFSKLSAYAGLKEVSAHISQTWKVPVEVLDIRLHSVELDNRHRIVRSTDLGGDPAGYARIDLGARSLLAPIDAHYRQFRVTSYNRRQMTTHHCPSHHEYLVSMSALGADCIINLPKMKTHRKVGFTGALKNIVGINGHKDWLPHHRQGAIVDGGDEYETRSVLKRIETHLNEATDIDPASRLNPVRYLLARLVSRLIRHTGKDPYREGSWYGNDTLWRTVLDLNRILVYADRSGQISNGRQRTCLHIVDGIIAGEGEGPMSPDVRDCGLIAGGFNPVAVDAVLATAIGFDYRRIPLITRAFDLEDYPLVDFGSQDITVMTDQDRWASLRVGGPCDSFRLKPASGWQGHVELA